MEGQMGDTQKMSSPFAITAIIAEQRIAEAMQNGEFDNLPGSGQPLPDDNMDNVPQELRMAYRILKNAGCLPPELAMRREACDIVEMLDHCPDEQEKIRQMRKLRLILSRMSRAGRNLQLEERDDYWRKILARLEGNERKLAK